MGINLPFFHGRDAVFVVKQHKANRHCTNNEEEHRGSAHATRHIHVIELGHAVGESNVQIYATSESEQKTSVGIRNISGENDDNTQQYTRARQEVEEQCNTSMQLGIWASEDCII